MRIVTDWMCEAWKEEQAERLFYSLWTVAVAAREPERGKIEGEASLRVRPGVSCVWTRFGAMRCHVELSGEQATVAFRVMWIAGVSAGGHQRDHRVEPGGWRSPGRGEERPRARASRSHFWREEEPARQEAARPLGGSEQPRWMLFMVRSHENRDPGLTS